MSTFYGQVEGMARTVASKRGGKEIKVSAQFWNGSVITRMYYNDDNQLIVELNISDGSSTYGYNYFTGTLEELKEKLR